MTYILQLIAIGISVLFLFELIMQMKKKKISEEHSVLWMMGVIGILCLSIFPNILTRVAHFLGVWWPPATLIFFLLTVLPERVIFTRRILSLRPRTPAAGLPAP